MEVKGYMIAIYQGGHVNSFHHYLLLNHLRGMNLQEPENKQATKKKKNKHAVKVKALILDL